MNRDITAPAWARFRVVYFDEGRWSHRHLRTLAEAVRLVAELHEQGCPAHVRTVWDD